MALTQIRKLPVVLKDPDRQFRNWLYKELVPGAGVPGGYFIAELVNEQLRISKLLRDKSWW